MAQKVSIDNVEPGLSAAARSGPVLFLFVVVAVSWPPAFVGRNAVQSVSKLFHLADSAHAYFVPDHAGLIGEAIEDRIGGYDELNPAAFRHSEMLRYVFPYAWDRIVPLGSYRGSPLIWNYYAHRKSGAVSYVNYVIQEGAHRPPAGMQLVIQQHNVALYVRSKSVWASHRSICPPTSSTIPFRKLERSISWMADIFDFARLYIFDQWLAFFVTPAKVNFQFRRLYSYPIDEPTGLRCD